MQKKPAVVRICAIVAFCVIIPAGPCFAYSVLTHQSIIDSAWEKSLEPLLKLRFPNASDVELKDARAYAYGGSIIQDMGYYPFGSKFFTDLVHYARGGDFVMALVHESSDLNEYAFALGALAHYTADNHGHPIAVNRAVALLYPKLHARYGNDVTYADSPAAHLKTEFGFDVVQVARGHYVSQAYHDFIGFKVAKPVLERAFQTTYGIEMKDVFFNLDLALGTYRHSVSSIIPEMTKVAWQTKKDEIIEQNPGMTSEKFMFVMSRPAYEREWGTQYEKPGIAAKVIAYLGRILPRVGPLKALAFKVPTGEAERLFGNSFDVTVANYEALLERVGTNALKLENLDFDTGRPARAGEYRLADRTYERLLQKLSKKKFENTPEPLRQNILAFYGNLEAPIATKERPDQWRRVLQELQQLRQATGATSDATPP